VGAVVREFRVHARSFEGSLADPQRNELRSADADGWDEVVGLAEELVVRGFAVWVYQHDHPTGSRPGDPCAASSYRVVAEWRADGRRVR